MKNVAENPYSYRLIFAKNIRKIRRLREISQERLALDAGCSKTYLCEIESGTRSVSIDVMGNIANALNIPLSRLLEPISDE
ncbi:MAG: helix-turn-helix transcriptional regulator [Neisseriaceae bacterium]|nr:helix-turn-helix transcriptional regulator [Neisseriaceae bacterium]MBP5790279.1 helix-turn-helix transcriptional regulator [Neisseriaceae bacterium]